MEREFKALVIPKTCGDIMGVCEKPPTMLVMRTDVDVSIWCCRDCGVSLQQELSLESI